MCSHRSYSNAAASLGNVGRALPRQRTHTKLHPDIMLGRQDSLLFFFFHLPRAALQGPERHRQRPPRTAVTPIAETAPHRPPPRPCAVREGRRGAVPFPLPAVPGLLSTWQRWVGGSSVCWRQVTAVRDACGAGTGRERRALGREKGRGARGAAAGVEGRRGLGEGPGSCEGLRAGTPSPAGVTHGSSHPAVVALALASEAAFVEDLDES